ncbi:universal stress protein [Oceanihabitans sp. 2_MG-2023]|uniref:universal stress protein n=1 Tax=Oceanihabitans sp. 2_MG-2023 TaxID=3062661 RepID=UPI0026E17C47|nr:universal stress protein [Oceanihabitans sp. 2_MG-2023]MDO6597077.1 universal stress protein [Oceanihabitans sp. 2_MG-2023]
MQNILLLTDFSNNAKNAIHYALHLFKNEKCTFHLMHVYKIGSYISDDLMYASKESVFESLTKEPKEKLEALVEELKNKFNNENYAFETIIDFDVFIDAINQAIRSKQIDFVVMGTNGATSAKEVLFGSNTVQVARKINCKTLIIPEAYSFTPIKELLLPLDPFDAIDGKQFASLLEFIENNKLRMHVLRVNPNNENRDIEDKDVANLYRYNCKYYIVNDVPMDSAISSYMQTNNIDFLSLFIKNEGFLENFFSKKNTKITIAKINKPILVLHP